MTTRPPESGRPFWFRRRIGRARCLRSRGRRSQGRRGGRARARGGHRRPVLARPPLWPRRRRGGWRRRPDRHPAAALVRAPSRPRHTAVYKRRGSGEQLVPYFDDLRDRLFATSAAFGHDRYATNTSTTFERVQPFPVFAHNGEIDTIGRLREEARSLRLPLSRDGSDSQDIDAVLRAMVLRLRLSPIEAFELLFPPIINEVRRMPERLQDIYTQSRAAFGPFAQGPAAFLARIGDTCVFGVDALGLRPLWHVETNDSHVFASERGFVPLERYVRDPYPLGPGVRVALRRDASGWRFLDESAVRAQFVAERENRGVARDALRERLDCGGPSPASRRCTSVARRAVQSAAGRSARRPTSSRTSRAGAS